MKKLTDLSEIAEALTELIDIARRMRGSYYFSAPSTAHERRAYERRNSCETFTFEFDDHTYECSFETVCSCKNVYAHGKYYRDGNKVTLRVLTACLARIDAIMEGGDNNG